jgi:hypothetical protein
MDAGEVKRDGNYILYDNGVVYDENTSLEWFVGPDKDMSWDAAKSWVENLPDDGGGWRMTTKNELKGLYQRGKGSHNMTPLLETTGWWVWSGETKGSDGAWGFSFKFGIPDWLTRSSSNYDRAFAVRSRK